LEQCNGSYSGKVFHSHDPCEMVYLGVSFGKLKLPPKERSQGYNLWREVKHFECPICKSHRLVETSFWINRHGDRHDDNEEIIGRVDKWKPMDLF
jgi:hypothetical protein